MNLNQASIIGRITRDPELRSMPNGTSLTTFSIATNYSYTDKAGQKIEKVSFHNCVLFGKSAEIFAQYVVKGQEVYVDGRIDYQEFEKKDGTKGSKTQIIVEHFQFGSRPKGFIEQQRHEETKENEEIDVDSIF